MGLLCCPLVEWPGHGPMYTKDEHWQMYLEDIKLYMFFADGLGAGLKIQAPGLNRAKA